MRLADPGAGVAAAAAVVAFAASFARPCPFVRAEISPPASELSQSEISPPASCPPGGVAAMPPLSVSFFCPGLSRGM